MGSSVIECPSCNTKFAVNLHLDSAQEPLFHCSRCGHYFREETKAKQLDLIGESLIGKSALSYTTAQDKLSVANTVNSTVSNNSAEIQQYSITQNQDKNKIFTIDAERLEKETSLDRQTKVDWPKPTYYFGENQFDEDNLKNDLENDLEQDLQNEEDNLLDKLSQYKSNNIKNFIKQFALFCFIPLLMAVGLCTWAYNIEKTPKALSSLFNLQSNNLATIAPAGLELSSLKPEVLTLNSGKKAFLIKGEVINSTTNTFKNLMIEAKLYTKDNTELIRLIAPLDSKLRDAKDLKALQSESLVKLQSDSISDKTTITPNMNVPFSVVIPEIRGNETWYSARVYSVNNV